MMSILGSRASNRRNVEVCRVLLIDRFDGHEAIGSIVAPLEGVKAYLRSFSRSWTGIRL